MASARLGQSCAPLHCLQMNSCSSGKFVLGILAAGKENPKMDEWGGLLRVQFPWQMRTHVGVEIGSEHLHRCYRFIQLLPPTAFPSLHENNGYSSGVRTSVSVDCCPRTGPNRNRRNVCMDTLVILCRQQGRRCIGPGIIRAHHMKPGKSRHVWARVCINFQDKIK